MAKEKVVDEKKAELKKSLESKNMIFGTKETLLSIKKGTVSKVFVSSNCPSEVKEDIETYKKINEFDIVYLDTPNDELGTLCKKPFSISILCEKNGQNKTG